MSILAIAFSLFILMDPIGNVPLFIAILKDINAKRQRFIIFREMVIALIIIIGFLFVGESILTVLHLDRYTVLISGGIILFLIALKMIFPPPKDLDTHHPQDKEPFIVPLAVPLTAGPAVLASVMLYSHEATNMVAMIIAILIAWTASLIILLGSSLLKKLLGARGIIACERLMGLILTLIAVQMFLEGVNLYLTHG